MSRSMHGLRKRFLVSEGELFRLYAEIEAIRAMEIREQYRARFNRLLREATTVHLVRERGKEEDAV